MSASRELALVTVSFRADLRLWSLQQRIIEELGIPFRRLTVVHTEDIGAFERERARSSIQCDIATTADFLPQEIERLRRGFRRRQLGYWLRHVRGLPTCSPGWHAQQFTKLAISASVSEAATVHLDSDVIPTDRWAVSDFKALGTGGFGQFESAEQDAEMAQWVIDAMRALDIPLQRTPMRRFTFCPQILKTDVTRHLLEYLERRHGRPWHEVMLERGLMEYSLYGAYACFIDETTAPLDPFPGCLISFPDQLERALHEEASTEGVRYVSIQSRLAPDAETVEALYRKWTSGRPGHASSPDRSDVSDIPECVLRRKPASRHRDAR